VTSDDETFTRLYHYGRFVMGMQPEEFWLTPIGLFFDLWCAISSGWELKSRRARKP